MCRKIPERTIKLISAGVFILFGFAGSYQVAADKLGLGTVTSAAILLCLMAVTGAAAYYLIKNGGGEAESQAVAKYCKVGERQNESKTN